MGQVARVSAHSDYQKYINAYSEHHIEYEKSDVSTARELLGVKRTHK